MSVPSSHESVSRSAAFMTRVDGLLEHAERLAQSTAQSAEFYQQVLSELADILEADGVAVWSIRDHDVSLFFDTNTDPNFHWGQSALEPIGRLEADRTVIVPPNVNGRLPNATEFARCIACQTVAPSLMLALDVRLPATAQRGENIAEVVTTVAAIVVEFHRGRQLTRLMTWNSERDRIATLCRSLHALLDERQIASELANDGPAVLKVDRVSVLLALGTGFQLEAATSVSELNHRANASRAIETLVNELHAQGNALPWTTLSENKDDEAIAHSVQKYLQESGAKCVRVEPLSEKLGSWEAALGAVVLEQFGVDQAKPADDGIAELCRNTAIALTNAVRLEAQSLQGQLRRWKALAKSEQARIIVGVTLGVLALLFIFPKDFELEVLGQVQPIARRQIYAPANGIITRVAVENAKSVAPGDLLAVMRNADLDLEEQRIRGEIATSTARLASVRAARVENDRRSPTSTSAGQLTAEEEELKQQITSLNRQLEIVTKRIAELTLRSPIEGKISRWDLIRSLESRPVQQGQLLMQVVDTNGAWQLELRIPDRSVRHVLLAQSQSQKPLPVRFLFRMSPKNSYSAPLDTVNLVTDLDEVGELSTLATVPLKHSEIPDLRPGSSVIAKIHCGRRSLAYVWLRELWEFLQIRVLF